MREDRKKKNTAGKQIRSDSYYQRLLNIGGCRESPPVEQKDLAWFDLSHYDYVRLLSLRQLMTELIVRGSLCSSPDIVTWDGTVLGPGEIFQTCYPKIIAGNPALHPLFISHEQIPELNYLPGQDAPASPILTLPVRELNIGDIDTCYHALSAADMDKEFFLLEESRHPCYLERISKSDIEPDTPLTTLQTQASGSHIEQIYLAVDPSFSKSQLIDAFRVLLTDLDNQYGIFKPSAGQNNGIRQKLLYDIQAYQLIPLIDLLLWQLNNRKKIPLRKIYNLLQNQSFDASSVRTGYSETNFRSSYLRTFDLVMNQGNPGEILSKLLEKTEDYDTSYYDATHV
ncbi:TPA: hypothetical protein MAK69_004255 [Klebsiella aerogenes]|uniref:DUF6387 family protein n=1 Tax=Enterobacteriaceae TaxID=543 RepID=UPI00075A7F21|nr:DUF6387 family protein [Klebsiella aerogenes]HEJ0382216.1 hypothetical protein [Enterobacter mori]KVI81386.1 hypothetical protein AWS46_00790 [Klebsiella aerogenes]KVI81531.1 hypothetical protein AWS47_14640 [Klebsiella aerogenes]HBS5782870.1 hypothetical protein [Klebsiella aerogenes]HEJ0384133.1 hypothetical protein [Enterobacter mori]